MAVWDHTLPQPHSTFTPYVLTRPGNCAITTTTKKANLPLKQSLFNSFPLDQELSKIPLFVVSNTSSDTT
jgi:hypothetical protein